MNPANFPDNKRRKQTDAKMRQTEWSVLTPQEKLRSLDNRPGSSKKERARITAKIALVKTATQLTDLMIASKNESKGKEKK